MRLLSVIHDLSAATKRAGVSGAADGEVSRVAKGADRKSAAVWGNDTGNKPVSGTASYTSAFKLSAGLLRRDGMAASACLPLGWAVLPFLPPNGGRWCPWIIAAALLAFGVIGWVVVAERPPKSQVRIEAARTLAADPDLRLVSERNPYMRTER